VLQTYTVSSNGVELNTGDSVVFNIDDIDSNCKIVHIAGTPSIEINQRGYYMVTFTSSGYNTGAVVEGTPYTGMYAFQLSNKGVQIVNSVASASSTADTDVVNVSFSVLIYVPPSCKVVDNNAVLTVDYLGQVGTLNSANLTVIKLR
jgi:hypothetical protein